MTKAEKTKKRSPMDMLVDQAKCVDCGHPLGAHVGTGGKCPALPPEKSQVVLDEAVVAKGGKPGSDFLEQLADATGATAAKEKAAAAAKLYAAEPVEIPAEVLQLQLDQLRANPDNPRKNLGDLTELAATIRKDGVQTPLSVRLQDGSEDVYEIISGHRRLEAARKAGLDSVPCIIHDGISRARALQLNLQEQVQREQLAPLEEGEGCRKLMELSGYSETQVAGVMGRTVEWVRGRLQLCHLAPEARKLLAEKVLPIGAAKSLAMLPQAQQAKVVKDLRVEAKREGELTIRATIGRALEFTRLLKNAPFDTKKEYFGVQAPACVKCPKNSACAPKGLFDAVDDKAPTCTDLECFEKKTNADYEEQTEVLAAAGAKVLPRTQGVKLFNEYRNALNYGSEYVDGAEHADDVKRRTWNQLAAAVPEKFRPQLVVASDHAGALHMLYDRKALQKMAEKHAGLKKPPRYNYNSGHSSDWQKKRKKELAVAKQRDAVADQVLEAVVRTAATEGLSAADWKMLATAEIDSAWDVHDGVWRAMGLLDLSETKLRAWVEKASTAQLQALIFGLKTSGDFTSHAFEPEFTALATRYDLDAKKMLKAQETGAAAEVALKAKKGGKK